MENRKPTTPTVEKAGRKMVVHEWTNYPEVNPRKELRPLRSVTVHPTFQGILENGMNDYEEFKRLASALEPDVKHLYVQVMGL